MSDGGSPGSGPQEWTISGSPISRIARPRRCWRRGAASIRRQPAARARMCRGGVIAPPPAGSGRPRQAPWRRRRGRTHSARPRVAPSLRARQRRRAWPGRRESGRSRGQVRSHRGRRPAEGGDRHRARARRRRSRSARQARRRRRRAGSRSASARGRRGQDRRRRGWRERRWRVLASPKNPLLQRIRPTHRCNAAIGAGAFDRRHGRKHASIPWFFERGDRLDDAASCDATSAWTLDGIYRKHCPERQQAARAVWDKRRAQADRRGAPVGKAGPACGVPHMRAVPVAERTRP